MMPPGMYQPALTLLLKHEGDRKRAYLDSLGNITIAIGHNLQSQDVADDIRLRWFREDLGDFYNKLSKTYPWFQKLNQARQIALLDMAFMGFKKLQTFVKMLYFLSESDFNRAAREILNSKYRKQVGQRAVDLANIIRSGNL